MPNMTRGSLVLFKFRGDVSLPTGTLSIYPSVEDALEDPSNDAGPRDALHEAIKRQGAMVEELDI
jgi:hypothetical protein